jgi:hypothetical protein
MREVIQEQGAAAAGGLFVYRSKLRAVLINCPKREDLDQMFQIENPLAASVPAG